MSKAESEGELEGGEKKGGGGRRCCDRFSCQSAAACLANRRERRARERGAEGDTERDAGQVLCFILAALLSCVRLRELQTCCEGVDLGAGRRSADPWITSSE